MLETLQVIWFILWALLRAVYFVLDGFDLGLGSLLPFIGSNEEERRIMYNAAGPFWDGNEVWLISAGGVTFAAFPKVYAVMFSALYAPLLILLFALIFRAVSFEFRGKVESGVWRGFWDLVHFLSNLVPSLLLGVTFANLFMGIPIDGEGVFHGTLMGLVNGYGIAGAIFFLVMFMLHGSLWLAIKSQGELQTRAVELEKKIILRCDECEHNHLKRLTAGQCHPATGVFYLELVSEVRKISRHFANIAERAAACRGAAEAEPESV